MKRKIIAFIICIAMAISLFPASAFAASGDLRLEQELAADLKELGIFKGVSDTDFALGRAPTRTEALIMLIRVLGKEEEALSKGGSHPFSDVPEWADKYVGYAYSQGLTNGVSATKFGGDSSASSVMYLTFVLRALGYSDANGQDFTWDNPYSLARSSGIMRGNPATESFLRADVVLVSYAALMSKLKGSNQTLAEKLIEMGVFTREAYNTHYNSAAFTSSAAQLSAEEIYAKCSPAVFYIEMFDERGTAFASGSGFFIDSNGTAVTNFHVISGAASAKVSCIGTEKAYDVVGVYDYNIVEDWAVIKVDGSGFPYLEIDETPVSGASTVYAIGSPLGLQNTISQGIISNTDRLLGAVSYIQISAPISSGSSGGALVNTQGKAIGITAAGFEDGQNLNLALPISLIKDYRTEALHEFSEVSAMESMPLENLNLSGLSKRDAAHEVLKQWLLTNPNRYVDGMPAVSAAYEYEGEGEAIGILATVMYNEKDDSFVAMATYYGAEDMAVASVEFKGSGDFAYMAYSYYDSPDSYEAVVGGGANVAKSKYSENMTVKFEEYIGSSSMRADNEKLAAAISYFAMDFVNYICTDYLAEYGCGSIGAFGFTGIK